MEKRVNKKVAEGEIDASRNIQTKFDNWGNVLFWVLLIGGFVSYIWFSGVFGTYQSWRQNLKQETLGVYDSYTFSDPIFEREFAVYDTYHYQGVTADSQGNIYHAHPYPVTQYGGCDVNDQSASGKSGFNVDKYSPTGELIGTLIVQCSPDTSHRFGDMVIDPSGGIYIADYSSNTLSKFNSSGALLWTYSNADYYSSPSSVAIGPDGNIYTISDWWEDSGTWVTVLTPAGSFVRRIYTTNPDNGGDPLCNPYDLEINSQGHMYIYDDCDYSIYKSDDSEIFHKIVNATGWVSAIDAHDNFYMADWDCQLEVYNSSQVLLYTFNACSGAHPFGDVDRISIVNEKLYIVDTANNQIDVYALNTQLLTETPTPTPTQTPTDTPTASPSSTTSTTPTGTTTGTTTPTGTSTTTPTQTATPTITGSATPTSTTAATISPTVTNNGTASVTATSSISTSLSQTITPTIVSTPLPTVTGTLPPVTGSKGVSLNTEKESLCPQFKELAVSSRLARRGENITFTWVADNARAVVLRNLSLNLATEGTFVTWIDKDSTFIFIAENNYCQIKKEIKIMIAEPSSLVEVTSVIAVSAAVELVAANMSLQGNIIPLLAGLLDRKKKRAYGIVYDAITKEPVSRVVVRLVDISNSTVVDTAVSDAKGIVRLIAKRGKYTLQVAHANYVFPSTIITSGEDGGYSGVYKGDIIEIDSPDQALLMSIPLDPINAASMEIRKTKSKLLQEALSTYGSSAVIVGGLVYNAYVGIVSPNLFNSIGIALYVFLLCAKLLLPFVMKARSFGLVSTTEGEPVGGVELGLFDPAFGNLLYRTFTTHTGQYNFVVGNNEYDLKILDERYTIVNQGTETAVLKIIKAHTRDSIQLITRNLIVKEKGAIKSG